MHLWKRTPLCSFLAPRYIVIGGHAANALGLLIARLTLVCNTQHTHNKCTHKHSIYTQARARTHTHTHTHIHTHKHTHAHTQDSHRARGGDQHKRGPGLRPSLDELEDALFTALPPVTCIKPEDRPHTNGSRKVGVPRGWLAEGLEGFGGAAFTSVTCKPSNWANTHTRTHTHTHTHKASGVDLDDV